LSRLSATLPPLETHRYPCLAYRVVDSTESNGCALKGVV